LVKLRLKRAGKKRKPFYKVVAADARSPRDGRVIEEVGTYDPNTSPVKVNFKVTRVEYWMKNGAQPTDKVYSLMKNEGIVYKLHLERKKKTAEEIEYALSAFNSNKEARIKKVQDKKLKIKTLRSEKKKAAKTASEAPKS
jgi:small subunit ribosomal protein S16